ncbi:hypothetical protein MKW98_000315 [Papaver atlanticum]|uniref:Uncharacterized protein n=1 Tax=Papaver atlanticum TaxID=357466 RepID=A0AAD4X6Y7_9MAGN|nr:hypothetical protein MKW98_000315 [Papaver atlanticum]
MLFARNFHITWNDNLDHWDWFSEAESATSDVVIQVAELISLCFLEVHGNLDISKLSPGVKYEAVFVVKLKDTAYGWEVLVNLRLRFPEGKRLLHREI